MITERPVPTRQRILEAALDLFGRQGYHGTSVGEIETAAGLVPRSGALYKHFPSKAALLEAVMQSRSSAVEDVEAAMDRARFDNPRADLELLGRLALEEITNDQPLLRVVLREGDNFPELRDEFHRRIVGRGHAKLVAWLRATARARGAGGADEEALAVVLVGSIINYCVLQTLFGKPPGGVGEDRFIAAWTDSAVALLGAHDLIDTKEAAS
jgi:AcrR family transcriptional regulator